MPLTYLSGVTGSAEINGTSLPFGKWKAPFKAKMIPNKNFLTAPYDAWVVGFIGSQIELEMPVYPAGTLGVTVTAGASATLTLGFTATLALTVPVLFETVEPANDADGAPTLRITAVSQGAFTASVT